MIHKSVSGTSLILALAAVLTWPVWGWDGDWTVDKKFGYLTKILVDADGNTVMLECKDGAPCDWALSAKNLFTCHQRMREAMKAVNPYIVDIYKPFRLDHTKPDETLKDNQHALTQWNAVMKDCVEGK